MTTVLSIGKAAFDAASAAITGSVLQVSVLRPTRGAFDTATGSRPEVEEVQTATARAVLDTTAAARTPFGDHIRGPEDQLWFVIELDEFVLGGDILRIAGRPDLAVVAAQHVLGAKEVAYVLTSGGAQT